MADERNDDAFDSLNRDLYQRDLKSSQRAGSFSEHRSDAATSWKDDAVLHEAVPGASPLFFKRLLIGSSIFLVAALAVASISFFGGINVISNNRINLSVLGPAFTEGGAPLDLQFDIVNDNRQRIEYADLVIEYPKGATLEGDGQTVRVRKFIGDIEPGGSKSERAAVTLFGEEGSERAVRAVLEYRVSGSNAIFVKETLYPVQIKSSPITLKATSLKEVTSRQEFTLLIELQANSETPLRDILVRVDYPPGFSVTKTEPAPASNNLWRLGDMPPGGKRQIFLTGSILAEDGDERSFRIYTGSENEATGEIGTVYGSLLQTVSVKKPFLETELSLNGSTKDDLSIVSNELVRGELSWVNNLPTRITDAEFEVRITGAPLDRASVSSPNGFFDSGTGILRWSGEGVPELRVMEGGDAGKLSFVFRVQPLADATRVFYANPALTFAVSVKGKRSSEADVPEAISASIVKQVKISSNAALSARTLYASGPFPNRGPLPPKAEAETTYNLAVRATNSANDISKSTITFKLPTYVRYLNQVSPASENVSYDAETRMVTWSVGRLESGTGISQPARELFLQVALTPSRTQIGRAAELSGPVVFSGIDDWSGARVEVSVQPFTTYLADPTFPSGSDIITQ